MEYQDSKTGFAEYEDHLRRSHPGHNPNDCFECHDMSLDQHPGNAHDPKRCRICISDAERSDRLMMTDYGYADEPAAYLEEENWAVSGHHLPETLFGSSRPRGIQNFAQNLDI